MAKTIEYIAALVRSAVTGEKPVLPGDADEKFDKIFSLSNAHGIAPMCLSSLLSHACISDENHIKAAKKAVYDASYEDARNDYAYNLACDILNRENIDFVPLKGVILKQLYPESYMRTSCDIDILVRKGDFKKAVSALLSNGFSRHGDLTFHDIILLYDGSVLELHFSICENNKNLDSVLKEVWKYTEKSENHRFFETNEYFVFHHIAHMAYHFLAGGCGVRPFVDYWILKNKFEYDEEEVISLCKAAKIGEFYDMVKQLTDIWFEGKEHTDITNRIEKYILIGGAYGLFPNNAAAYTVMNGGKTKYILSLAFPKYVNMKVLYPVLGRAPFLLPVFYVYRLYQKTLGRNSESAKKRYKAITGQAEDTVREVEYLLKTLNLSK